MKPSNFRIWLERKFFEYKDECSVNKEQDKTLREYFGKYKYWLKREFRHQQKMDKQTVDSNGDLEYTVRMKAYEFKYYERNCSDIKTATVVASTLPSAINLFEQMYYGCTVLDAKEKE